MILQVVKKHYDGLDAILDSDQEVVFEADEITLDIPSDGRTIKKSWKIVPLIKPKVFCHAPQ